MTDQTISQSSSVKDVVPRNLDFELDETVKYDWLDGCPGKSNYLNALSVLFPEGETFFIDSTRPFIKDATDPKLKKELKNFMVQEAFHTREHEAYNAMLVREGITADVMERRLKRVLDFGRANLPKMHQLAITVVLEHWTASLASILLENPDVLKGAHPKMRNMWLWHAVEESEHKAVCFDLMKAACKDEKQFYRARIRAHFAILVPFLGRTLYYYLTMMHQTGNLFNFRAHGRVINQLWGKPGVLRKMWPMWKDFFRKDFHPWDHDNRDMIAKWDEQAGGKDAIPADFQPA